jgi:cobalt-zinc-cadmium resistance protein CzcA
MFLTNVRGVLIVAVNIPLALLFAFAVLFLRGKSANLLSIGAVDFGIIVDSSVIIVENIYRHLSCGLHAELPIGQRIILASNEIHRCLFYSTSIMICAFLPLFTMSGPEGQIFGPMAETYAFALGGALLLALTLSPVLCTLFLAQLKPTRDNFLVRALQTSYLRQLQSLMHHRWLTLAFFGVVVAGTVAVLPYLGSEFMPELEEGNIWVQAQFPLNSSLEEVCALSSKVHEIMKHYPETEMVLTQVGRPDDGTDPAGFYNAEYFMPLKPESKWPIPPGRTRPRTKQELTDELSQELKGSILSVEWNFSQNIRNMVMESMSGVRGENSVKIIGPDLEELERAADRVVKALRAVPGLDDVGTYRILGQSNLMLPIDRRKCGRWNLKVGDVQAAGETAVGGKPFSQMIEGERSFDITLRFPKQLRSHLKEILDIPVDVAGNTVANSQTPGQSATPVSGGNSGPSSTGSSANLPSLTGSAMNATMNDLSRTPRRRLGDMLTPLGPDGKLNPGGSFFQRGASDIYRDQGERLIAIKFDIHGRDLAGAVAEAQQKCKDLVTAPCRLEWTGEFQEMEQAERRLLIVIPLATGMVMVLLYLAFRSLTDVFLVLSNVVTMVCGGIWALLLTHTNFSISAAVGFISIFGVAVMNGLLLVSSFHRLRLDGVPFEEAILQGSGHRLRPMMMTALTAVFGLLPAALSTRIGAQTQRPLAIVVIGGMLVALFLNRYLTPVLYGIFRRHPPTEESAGLAE